VYEDLKAVLGRVAVTVVPAGTEPVSVTIMHVPEQEAALALPNITFNEGKKLGSNKKTAVKIVINNLRMCFIVLVSGATYYLNYSIMTGSIIFNNSYQTGHIGATA
jgi:hypothetical protein